MRDSDAPTADLLTVPECARVLHVGRATVYRLVSRGELPAIRLGSGRGRGQMIRVESTAIGDFLERRVNA